MKNPLSRVWESVVKPVIERPPHLQVGALCHRGSGVDTRVLLITSRDTGRWIIPKGWLIVGKTAPEAALQEAWEEAGVRQGTTLPDALGSYVYEKRLKTGLAIPVETLVFSVEVDEMKDDFPEAQERKRMWVTPQEGANMVAEPELQHLLRDMAC